MRAVSVRTPDSSPSASKSIISLQRVVASVHPSQALPARNMAAQCGFESAPWLHALHGPPVSPAPPSWLDPWQSSSHQLQSGRLPMRACSWDPTSGVLHLLDRARQGECHPYACTPGTRWNKGPAAHPQRQAGQNGWSHASPGRSTLQKECQVLCSVFCCDGGRLRTFLSRPSLATPRPPRLPTHPR